MTSILNFLPVILAQYSFVEFHIVDGLPPTSCSFMYFYVFELLKLYCRLSFVLRVSPLQTGFFLRACLDMLYLAGTEFKLKRLTNILTFSYQIGTSFIIFFRRTIFRRFLFLRRRIDGRRLVGDLSLYFLLSKLLFV
jgi:hypothetical protein